jgi:peptidyl-prolyl cis-trans isomerase D
LRAFYENVKDRYVEPERRKSRHILIKVEQGGDENAARKKADEVLAKAKAPGADFSALAKQLSEDAGSAEQGGDLGWAERSFFVGPFSDALFAMQVDEIRGPVRSEFGYHIIRLDGIQPGKQKTFDEARAEIESEYRTQEAEKLFGDRQEQLAEKAFENLDNLDKVASDMGLTVQSVPDFKRSGGGGALGQNANVMAAAFSDNVLLNGQNSEPIELEPGHVVVLRVDDRKTPQERPLSEVRGEIVALLKKQGTEQLARKRGEEALARLKAGTPWSTVVSELKVKAEGPTFVSRTAESIPGGLRQALFLAPRPAAGKPHYQTVALPGSGYGLIAFSGVRAGTAVETADQREARVRQAAMRVQRAEVTAYVEELRRKADVDTNPKAFE